MRGKETILLDRKGRALVHARDEAHRFSNAFHKKRRGKGALADPLEEVDGLGAKKIQALLRHFGGRKGIEHASVKDLRDVPGIGRRWPRGSGLTYRGDSMGEDDPHARLEARSGDGRPETRLETYPGGGSVLRRGDNPPRLVQGPDWEADGGLWEAVAEASGPSVSHGWARSAEIGGRAGSRCFSATTTGS